MQNNDYCLSHPYICKSLRFTSTGLPLAALIFGLFYSWTSGFSRETTTAHIFLFAFSCVLARFMARRAKNQEAHFFVTVVLPDDDEVKKYSCDLMGLVSATVFFLMIIFMPIL